MFFRCTASCFCQSSPGWAARNMQAQTVHIETPGLRGIGLLTHEFTCGMTLLSIITNRSQRPSSPFTRKHLMQEIALPKEFTDFLPEDLRAYALYIAGGGVCIGALILFILFAAIVRF